MRSMDRSISPVRDTTLLSLVRFNAVASARVAWARSDVVGSTAMRSCDAITPSGEVSSCSGGYVWKVMFCIRPG